MMLDLREIIDFPGRGISFDFSPDLSAATGSSVIQIIGEPKASGSVKNNAGLLNFSCKIDALLLCACARCLKEFKYPLKKVVTVDINKSSDGEESDGYPLTGNEINVSEIISAEIILGLDDKILCADDCKGLCAKCGADLNTGRCVCPKDIDHRLAVLEQLLDYNDGN